MKLKKFKKKLTCFRSKQTRHNMEQAIKMKDWRKEAGRQVSNYRQIKYKIKVFHSSKRYWMICKIKFNCKWRTHWLSMALILFWKKISKVLRVDIQSSINLKSKIYIIKNTSLITLGTLNQNKIAKKFNFKMNRIKKSQENGWFKKWSQRFNYKKNKKDMLLFQMNSKAISRFLKQNQAI